MTKEKLEQNELASKQNLSSEGAALLAAGHNTLKCILECIYSAINCNEDNKRYTI